MAGLHDTVTFTDLTLTASRRWSDRVAFRQGGTEWKFAEIEGQIARLVALLASRGVGRIGPVLAQLCGQTECMGLITSMARADRHVDDLGRLTACGAPMPGVRVAILDEDGDELGIGELGEVCVQGASVMQGYWKQSELTAETLAGGWLHTGDIGVWGDDGFITLVDRKKDMIVSGGFNVFPREVEDVLSTDPAVSNAAVIGVPGEKWGEAVTALVVLKPGATCDPDELRTLVKERKGAISAPEIMEFVDALPLTPVGKGPTRRCCARSTGAQPTVASTERR